MSAMAAPPTTVEHEIDGSTVHYFPLAVNGDQIERLMTELFSEHWRAVKNVAFFQHEGGRFRKYC